MNIPDAIKQLEDIAKQAQDIVNALQDDPNVAHAIVAGENMVTDVRKLIADLK